MGRIAFDGFDQVRHKVVALAKCSINIGPTLIAILAHCHEVVINAGDQEDQNNRDAD
jgi:hypothetical protein